jgi:predicted MFS family arabinose efflux permease
VGALVSRVVYFRVTLFPLTYSYAIACLFFSAFWTWCPVVWEAYLEDFEGTTELSPSLVTFMVISFGGLGCVLGGYLSLSYGSANVAFGSLAISGFLCLLSPALYLAPLGVMLPAYLVWGMAVVADSPQFSTLIAQTAPPESKGTALTIVNCIGFAITIGSIQLLSVPVSPQYVFLLLVPGPILGLWCLWTGHIRPQYKTTTDEKGNSDSTHQYCTTTNNNENEI